MRDSFSLPGFTKFTMFQVYSFRFFSITGYYKILNIVPCRIFMYASYPQLESEDGIINYDSGREEDEEGQMAFEH